MILETRFNIGDIVWAFYPNEKRGPLTIGRVSKTFTDSPGRQGEEVFDNYKQQFGVKEEYMCVETGIGSGTLYPVEILSLSGRQNVKG